MALTRPIINNIPAFDATKPYVVTFSANGSSTQIVGNKLIIQRNDNLAVVYEQQIQSYSYSHTIPQNTLSNGVNYVATVYTIAASGEQSPTSRGVSFYCFETPIFQFTNVGVGGQISSNSYQFEVSYSQQNGELLNSAVINLYDSNMGLVATSGSLTGFNLTPVIVSYLFSGFSNNREYFIQATGTTLHGMQISTEAIRFLVLYSESDVYSKLLLTNNCRNGYIEIQSNVTAIGADSNPINPDYPNNNSINLIDDGAYVNFNSGYEVNGDFIAKLWGTRFNANSNVLQFSNINNGIISVNYKVENDGVYAELTVYDSGRRYIADSNKIQIPTDSEQLLFILRRINNIYEITLTNKGVVA